MKATEIMEMLATRHALDVYVPECKDGPSQTRNHRRLDAWVLLKTWSPITSIGYEVKVDKGDWRRDEKIHDYMPLCHLLYIVAPKGVVPMEELPAGVGLLEPVGSSGRLQARRKAARREIVLPAELMVYVLMCRTKITRDRYDVDPADRHWRTEQLREWVAGKEDRTALSYAVSRKIQSAFGEQARRLTEEKRRNDSLSEIQKRVTELGFDPLLPVGSWAVLDKLNALNRVVDSWTLREMRDISVKLTRVADTLEKLKEGKTDESEVA